MTALLLVAGVLVFDAGRFSLRVRGGQRVRATALRFERIVPNATTRILIAGDSVAFGTGADKPEDSIAGLFGQDFPNAEIVNVGVNGQKLGGVAATLAPLAGQRFDLVVLICGGNDVLRFTPLAQLNHDAKAAVAAARTLGPVVWMPEGNLGNAPLFPRWISWLLNRRSTQARAVFRSASAGASYVDVFLDHRHDPRHKDASRYYSADRFHPAAAGYRYWYDAIRRQMIESRIALPT